MAKYRLLKDIPGLPAGTIFEEEVFRSYDGGEIRIIKPFRKCVSLEWRIDDMDNFDEWFERVDGPINGIYWKPVMNDEYWYVDDYGNIECSRWDNDSIDKQRYALGIIRPTETGAEDLLKRQIAITTLIRSSDFEPNWRDTDEDKWCVRYNELQNKLLAERSFNRLGLLCPYYKTQEEAQRSIEEYKKEWLTYFDVEV